MKLQEALNYYCEGKAIRCVKWADGDFIAFGGATLEEICLEDLSDPWELYEEVKWHTCASKGFICEQDPIKRTLNLIWGSKQVQVVVCPFCGFRPEGK